MPQTYTKKDHKECQEQEKQIFQEETLKEVVIQHQVDISEVVYIDMCQHAKREQEFERVLEGVGSMGRV